MSTLANKTADHELITRIEQFYFKEARLLDERCYKQWFNLVDPTIEYSIPARYVPQPDPDAKETEDFLSIERELDRADGSKGLPLRQDGYMETFARTMRMYKTNAWSESPAPRTRRFISNVEVEPLEENEYRVYSNFQMFYSHRGADNHTYTGGRRDILKRAGEDFRICKREVITDWDIITVPTVAFIF